MNLTAESLINGYEAYVSQGDLVAMGDLEAPAASPAILSFIGASSLPCGGAVSAIGGSAIATVAKGC